MTSTDLPETRKRKRFSKNKKKSWRKTDVDDVEEFLEDQRLQERTGGLVAEKSDEQLFFVDKVVPEDEDESSPKKKRRQPKPLKSHALLEPDANIKPARVKHNVPVYSIKKHAPAVQEKKRRGVISLSEQRAQHQRQTAVEIQQHRRDNRHKLRITDYDLWGTKNAQANADADPYYLEKTKQVPVKRPAQSTFYKQKKLAAVEVPHPGASYNPTYDDHQELLNEALQVEEKKEKDALRVKRALDDQFPKGHEASTEMTWLTEMSAGIADHDSEAGSGAEDDGELRLSVNPPVRREDKKTEKQRRKEQQKLTQEKLLSREKRTKQRKNEVFRLKRIKADVASEMKALEEKGKKRAAIREQKQQAPRKLGKLKFEAAELEIKLSDEIQGSLRQLKPEGHLMEDRFKSLQKRNIIEPRLRAKKVLKFKKKAYTKKSHKDVILPNRRAPRKR